MRKRQHLISFLFLNHEPSNFTQYAKKFISGRDWRWDFEQRNAKYISIMNMFEDNKSANYSIHQIALMGASSENKDVGQWFGPNTVAQVIK